MINEIVYGDRFLVGSGSLPNKKNKRPRNLYLLVEYGNGRMNMLASYVHEYVDDLDHKGFLKLYVNTSYQENIPQTISNFTLK